VPQSVFRLGDIRGRYPTEINENFVRSFGPEFVLQFKMSGRIATGRDTRDSSLALQETLNTSLRQSGIDVMNLGICATELGSFASFQADIEAVIIVTASHNTPDYNGLKCILRNGEAITYETGLKHIESRMNALKEVSDLSDLDRPLKGSLSNLNLVPDYVHFLTNSLNHEKWHLGKLALNGLHGTASTLATPISKRCELNSFWYKQEPGTLDSLGVDPSHPKHTADMKQFMASRDFELGVAWDGDSDRCAIFDEAGCLIPSYYMVGIFTEYFLQQNPGAAIVFDTKLCWNTLDIIQQYNGKAVPSQTGHAFVIHQMKKHNAVYGGELSGHHYFGEFNGCDSGMLAWLMTLVIIQSTPCPLEELVDTMRKSVKCTQEINLSLQDSNQAINQIMSTYGPRAKKIDELDGISLEMPGDWRFSLRNSKTETKLRLNLETRSSGDALIDEGEKIIKVLRPFMLDDQGWENEFILQ